MKKFAVIVPCCMMIALALTVGCGQKLPEGMPDLYPTTLTVKFDDGSPVSDATVLLIPKEGGTNSDWGSGGTTGEDGRIKLMTRGQYDGVPAGSYVVTVTKNYVEPGEPNEADFADADTYQRALQQFKTCTSPEPYTTYNAVNPDFGVARTTTLELTVEAKKGNLADLNVGEKGKYVN